VGSVPCVPVISVDSLTKQFGSGVLAVDDLSFEVESGRVCGLLGPNGAGKTTTYSLGMHQRLGLARALLSNPDLLILDEPTVGLDPQEMRSVRHLLRDVADEGATVLLSSHLLAEVEEVCTDLVVMDRGRLVAAGLVADFVRRGAATAYFEVDDIDAAKRVLSALPGVRAVADAPPGLSADLNGESRAAAVAALVHAGVGVQTVTQHERLEDVFVGLVGEETQRQ